MLSVTQKASFTGESQIDGTTMERYTSQIDIDNPENITLSRFIVNRDGYRDNREVCQKDQAEFEDIIYAAQAEMMEADGKVANDTPAEDTTEEEETTDTESVEVEDTED